METNNATLATLLDSFMEAMFEEHVAVHFKGEARTNQVTTAYDKFANALKKLSTPQREIFWLELAREKSPLVSTYCQQLESWTKDEFATKQGFYGVGALVTERLLAKLTQVTSEVKPVEKLPEKVEEKVEEKIMQPLPEYTPQDPFIDSLRYFETLPTEANHGIRPDYTGSHERRVEYYTRVCSSYVWEDCAFIRFATGKSLPDRRLHEEVSYDLWGQPDYLVKNSDPEEWEESVWFRNWFSARAWAVMYGTAIPDEFRYYTQERGDLERKTFYYNVWVTYFSKFLARTGWFPRMLRRFLDETNAVMEEMTSHYAEWATANIPGYVPPVALSEKPVEKAPEVKPEILVQETEENSVQETEENSVQETEEIFEPETEDNMPQETEEIFEPETEEISHECEVGMVLSEERNTRWEAERELSQQLKAEEAAQQEFPPDLAAFLARNRHMANWLPFFPETMTQARELTLVSDLPNNAKNFTEVIAAYLKNPSTTTVVVSAAPAPVEVCVSTPEVSTPAPVVVEVEVEDEWTTPEKVVEEVEEVSAPAPRVITPADTERLLERQQNAHDRLLAFGPAVKKYDKVLLAVRALVHELGQAFNRAQMGEEAVPPACVKVLAGTHARFHKELSELGQDGEPGFWQYLYHMHSSTKTGWKKFGKILSGLVNGCKPNCSTYWGIDAETVTTLSGKFAKWAEGVDCPAFPTPQVEEKPEEIEPAGEEFSQPSAETLEPEETEELEDIFLPAPEYFPETSGNQQEPEAVVITDNTPEEIMEPVTTGLLNILELGRYLPKPPIYRIATAEEVEIYRSNSRRLVENWDLTLVPEHLRSAVDFQSTVEKLAAYTLEMVEELAEWRLDLLARGYVPEKPGSWKEPKVVVPVSKKPKEIMETVKISLASVAEVAPYLSYPPVSGSLTTMKEVEAFRKASRKALKEMDLTRVPETMRSAKNFQTILNGFSLHAMEIVEQQCQAAIDYHHLTPVYNPLEYVEAIEQCAGEFQTALRELGEREQVEADALTHKFTHSKRTPDPEVIQEKFATLRLKFETRRAKLSAKYEKLQAKLEEKATKAAAKAEKAAAKLAKLEEKAAAKLAKLEEKAAKAAAKAERQPKSRAKVVTEVAPQPTEPTAKALARAAKEAEKAEKAAAKAAKAAANAVKLVQKGAEVLDEGSWKNREFRPTIEPEAEQELQEYADSMGIPVDHQLVEARRFFLYIHSRGASLWASVECALNFAKAEGLDVLGALERNTPKSRGHVTATLCRPMYDMGFSHQFDRLTNEQKVDVKNAYEVVHAHNVTAANFDRLTTYEKGVLTYHFLYETGNFSKKCREISGGC